MSNISKDKHTTLAQAIKEKSDYTFFQESRLKKKNTKKKIWKADNIVISVAMAK